jgi:hypothetical protein
LELLQGFVDVGVVLKFVFGFFGGVALRFLLQFSLFG